MATSLIAVTEGSGKNAGTYSLTEDAVTKHIQRAALNNSSGVEIGTTSNPLVVAGVTADNAAMSTTKLVGVGGMYNAVAPTYADGDAGFFQIDANGFLKTSLATLIAGEDITNGVMKTERQYSYSRKTADGQVKGTAGYIHTLTIAPTTASVTAGVLTVYDSASESGTVIYSEYIPAGVVPHTVTLDVVCGTGIYIGFDGTLANVQAMASYR